MRDVRRAEHAKYPYPIWMSRSRWVWCSPCCWHWHIYTEHKVLVEVPCRCLVMKPNLSYNLRWIFLFDPYFFSVLFTFGVVLVLTVCLDRLRARACVCVLIHRAKGAVAKGVTLTHTLSQRPGETLFIKQPSGSNTHFQYRAHSRGVSLSDTRSAGSGSCSLIFAAPDSHAGGTRHENTFTFSW